MAIKLKLFSCLVYIFTCQNVLDSEAGKKSRKRKRKQNFSERRHSLLPLVRAMMTMDRTDSPCLHTTSMTAMEMMHLKYERANLASLSRVSWRLKYGQRNITGFIRKETQTPLGSKSVPTDVSAHYLNDCLLHEYQYHKESIKRLLQGTSEQAFYSVHAQKVARKVTFTSSIVIICGQTGCSSHGWWCSLRRKSHWSPFTRGWHTCTVWWWRRCSISEKTGEAPHNCRQITGVKMTTNYIILIDWMAVDCLGSIEV